MDIEIFVFWEFLEIRKINYLLYIVIWIDYVNVIFFKWLEKEIKKILFIIIDVWLDMEYVVKVIIRLYDDVFFFVSYYVGLYLGFEDFYFFKIKKRNNFYRIFL